MTLSKRSLLNSDSFKIIVDDRKWDGLEKILMSADFSYFIYIYASFAVKWRHLIIFSLHLKLSLRHKL